MTISDAPPRRYGSPPTGTRRGTIATTREGGGYVVTCDCLWLRWEPSEKDAAEVAAAHMKKCKGPRPEEVA